MCGETDVEIMILTPPPTRTQAQGECAGLRARVRELEGLEQDLATLKIALESSERIRLQQKVRVCHDGCRGW